VDNEFDLFYVNGVNIDVAGEKDSWQSPKQITFVETAGQFLALNAFDHNVCPNTGCESSGGFMMGCASDNPDSLWNNVYSNTVQWKSLSLSSPDQIDPNWYKASFDDSSWESAIQASSGMSCSTCLATNRDTKKIWGRAPGVSGGYQYTWFRVFLGGLNAETCSEPSGYSDFPNQAPGYVFTDLGSYAVGAPYQVLCADGYSGSPEQVTCVTGGVWSPAPKVWSGCSPITCATPRSKVGYIIADGQSNWASTRAISCTLGYTGDPAAISCQSNGQWTSPVGCTAVGCGPVPGHAGFPAEIGYTFEEGTNFATGATRAGTCATGYTGKSSAIKCESGSWTTPTGCGLIVSGQPSATITDDEAAGYEIPGFVMNTKYLDSYVVECDHAAGYPGMGLMVCTGQDEWTLTECEPGCPVAAKPDQPAGYGSWPSAFDDLTHAGTKFTLTCQAGFSASDPALTCGTDQTFTVSGCTAIQCDINSGSTGTAASCTCAAGFEGTVVYAGGETSGCTPCTSGEWAQVGNGNSCAKILCNAVGYSGSAGACTCANGYSGRVQYVEGVLAGCTAIPCDGDAFTGTAGACMCAAGYEGTVVYGSALGGCSPCGSTSWSVAGNGNSCAGVPCTEDGYTGQPSQCTCAAGFTGTSVTYTDGVLGGCTAITCDPEGYTGTAGQCTCDEGFEGTVTYSGGAATGCSPCPSGEISPVDGTCEAIVCSSTPGYTGTAGACECDAAAHYYGSVTYTPHLSGCVQRLCQDPTDLTSYADWIQTGVDDFALLLQVTVVTDAYLIAPGDSLPGSTRDVDCNSCCSGNPLNIFCDTDGKWDVSNNNLAQKVDVSTLPEPVLYYTCVNTNLDFSSASVHGASLGLLLMLVSVFMRA
jgi:hypothetical protein